ncbi:MAG: T9SS type A sorting domain-containing protein [bacterium]
MKKRLLLVLVASFAMVEWANAQPTASSDNGVLSFSLNSYGRFRAGALGGDRHLDRMSLIAALSQDDVFDYNEDANVTAVTAQGISIPGVDTALVCVSDNTYINEPPKIKAEHTVYAWQNTNYVLIRHRVINDSSASQTLYLGVAVIPQPSATYGGETLGYDAGQSTAYYFRAGEMPYLGTRLLSKPAYSVKLFDWDSYSPNPSSDAATDSTRYAATATAGFDNTITAGANGCIYHHNAGQFTIAPGDTAEIVYAFVYGTSLNDLLANSALAQARHDGFFTSVTESPVKVPASFALEQNYPNPFNPSTQIRFTLAQRGEVQLTVYDANGHEVKTLMNGVKPAGEHVLTFDANGLSSGVYFYRLRTEEFTATRKMVLMR